MTPRRFRWLEVAMVAAYLALMGALFARCALLKPLWFDELFTLYLARSPQDVWANLRAGVDLHPPLSYLLTHLGVAAFGETELALRLPAIGGGLVAMLALYLTVRGRRGPGEAFLAMTIVGLCTPACIYFYEARSYGLTFGFVGLAIWCRQRRSPLAFAACVGCGMATHYYFAVAVLAFGLAEVARAVELRRLDWKMVAGLAVSVVVLGALSPLWTEGPKAYKAGFWGKVRLDRASVETAYSRLADKSLLVPLAFAFGAATVVGRRDPLPKAPTPEPDTSRSDSLALVGLLAAPALGLLVAAKFAGGWDGRYTLFAVLGLAAVLARALASLAGQSPAVTALLCATFTGFGVLEQGNRVPDQLRRDEATIRAVAETINERTTPGEPVLLTSNEDAAKLWHYGLTHARILYLADPAHALRRTGVNTAEQAFLDLCRVAEPPIVCLAELHELLRTRSVLSGVGKPPEIDGVTVTVVEKLAPPGGRVWYRLSFHPHDHPTDP